MNTARDFGDYDVLAEAVWIAWRAEQRLTWQASRRWYDRALDALAASVVWLAAGALVLLAAAALLVCVALAAWRWLVRGAPGPCSGLVETVTRLESPLGASGDTSLD